MIKSEPSEGEYND